VSDLPEYAQTLIRLGIIIVVALVATRICLVLVRRMQRRLEATEGPRTDLLRRSHTLTSVLRGAIVVVIWTVAVITALGQAGVEVGPIIAAAGIGGIALGFGAQSLVKDVLAGFFILLESQYDVGDVIRVAGVAGSVESVNLRTTTLRDLDGSRHVVPNGLIEVSTNLTKVYSRYVLVMPVPYEADVDRAVAVLERVAEELRGEPAYREVVTGPLTVLGVDAYGDSASKPCRGSSGASGGSCGGG
jgi:moderate conductance mechanosensitive channel